MHLRELQYRGGSKISKKSPDPSSFKGKKKGGEEGLILNRSQRRRRGVGLPTNERERKRKRVSGNELTKRKRRGIS